jgi:hypothetical protein
MEKAKYPLIYFQTVDASKELKYDETDLKYTWLIEDVS